jgi:hypothetical protein
MESSIQLIDLTAEYDVETISKQVAESLHLTGCLMIRHPIIDQRINDR